MFKTGKMTKEGQVKFKARFNKDRTNNALLGIQKKLPLLKTAIKTENSDDIEYYADLIADNIAMIKRCL